MSELHDMNTSRPAPRAASPLVLWLLSAVAVGGVWLLLEGASQMTTVPIASTTGATTVQGGSGARPAIAPDPALALTAAAH